MRRWLVTTSIRLPGRRLARTPDGRFVFLPREAERSRTIPMQEEFYPPDGTVGVGDVGLWLWYVEVGTRAMAES
jgi:hypothetical protein